MSSVSINGLKPIKKMTFNGSKHLKSKSTEKPLEDLYT